MKKLHIREKTPGLEGKKWVSKIIGTLFPPATPWIRSVRGKPEIDENDLFTIEELQMTAKSLKDDTAPGPDGIPNIIIKQVVRVYPQIMLRAFNACLREGKFW